MLNIILQTEKARVLILDLPADATDVSVKDGKMIHYYGFNRHYDHQSFYVDIPAGTWLPAGKLGEVTEEVAAKIVPDSKRLFGGYYFDYKKKANVATSPVKSLRSLLLANEVKLENPFGDRPDIQMPTIPDSSDYEEADQIRAAWQAEEETVYRNAFLFYELI